MAYEEGFYPLPGSCRAIVERLPSLEKVLFDFSGRYIKHNPYDERTKRDGKQQRERNQNVLLSRRGDREPVKLSNKKDSEEGQ